MVDSGDMPAAASTSRSLEIVKRYEIFIGKLLTTMMIIMSIHAKNWQQYKDADVQGSP